MREIKFRGKKINGSGWIYGMPNYQMTHIFNDSQVDSVDNYEVIPETIGQFIGIDTKGKEVYDGDYMRYRRRNGQWCKCTVVYRDAGFSFENKTEYATYHAAIFMNKGKIYAEKIGNKFDSKPLTVNRFRDDDDF